MFNQLWHSLKPDAVSNGTLKPLLLEHTEISEIIIEVKMLGAK